MTLPIVDDSSPLDSDTLHKFMWGDGKTSGHYKTVSYRINYTGSVWAVATTFGTKESQADLGVTWNSGDKRLDLAMGSLNFATAPTIIVSPWCGTTTGAGAFNHIPHGRCTSSTAAFVRFESRATRATEIATEDVNMIFGIILIGQIA